MQEDYRNTKGNVFNIQRFSTDDGPGIRNSVFLKGCPLRCQWCHNSESLDFKSEVTYYSNNCIGCLECKKTCPIDAITVKENRISIDREKCNRCFECCKVCTPQALVRTGDEKTCEEVMEAVKRDLSFYGSKGGMTVSGGEPMSQFEFTYGLARMAKNDKISFMIETSGFGKTEDFIKLVPYCDCFLFDCKASSKKHKELTGVDDDLILKNLDAICNAGAKVVLRCPIVPGGNLDGDFIEKIKGLAQKYDNIEYVQLMPYHKIGVSKSLNLGLAPQKEFEVPDGDTLEAMADRIRQSGKKVIY